MPRDGLFALSSLSVPDIYRFVSLDCDCGDGARRTPCVALFIIFEITAATTTLRVHQRPKAFVCTPRTFVTFCARSYAGLIITRSIFDGGVEKDEERAKRESDGFADD